MTQSEASRRWKERHPEQVKAAARAYHEKNRDRERERCRAYDAAHKADRAAYREAHKEHKRAYSRKYHAENKEKRRVYNLRVRYGLTPEEFAAMSIDQEGKCACCGRGRALIVDHCHVSGIVRGLVCYSCNVGIGLLGDDEESLQRALQYLRRRS